VRRVDEKEDQGRVLDMIADQLAAVGLCVGGRSLYRLRCQINPSRSLPHETSSPSPDASRASSLSRLVTPPVVPVTRPIRRVPRLFGLVRRLIQTVRRLIRAVTRRVRADRMAAQAGS
jgi:hypothetical protein